MTTDIDVLKEFEWKRMRSAIYSEQRVWNLARKRIKMLKILKEKKELPEACETTLAKKKADNLPAFVMNTLTSYF